jgi:hypothetical protein
MKRISQEDFLIRVFRAICGRLPIILAVFGLAISNPLQAGEPLYANNFEKAAVDKVPDDFLVLEGEFRVKQEGGNKFLELPGAPLDTFGVLFGPTEKKGWTVTARILGTAKGRRAPSFSVGLNGGGGYRLQVSPAKKLLELYRGDIVKASSPYEWESGKWTHLRLQIEKTEAGSWKLLGKVWAGETAEPEKPAIAFEDKEEPPAGRASIWASPYSGTPLRFDDLVVSRMPEKP